MMEYVYGFTILLFYVVNQSLKWAYMTFWMPFKPIFWLSNKTADVGEWAQARYLAAGRSARSR